MASSFDTTENIMLHEGRKTPQNSIRAQITPSNSVGKLSSFNFRNNLGSSSFHTPSNGPSQVSGIASGSIMTEDRGIKRHVEDYDVDNEDDLSSCFELTSTDESMGAHVADEEISSSGLQG